MDDYENYYDGNISIDKYIEMRKKDFDSQYNRYILMDNDIESSEFLYNLSSLLYCKHD